jgi:hypothetical protein
MIPEFMVFKCYITLFSHNSDQTWRYDIWRNIESTIRLVADDCIIYRKVKNNYDKENLQTDLNRHGKWAVENAMTINPTKSKVVCFMRA